MRQRLLRSGGAGAVILLFAASAAWAQMTGAGRMPQKAKPLPPGLRAPEVRYEDLAARAGLTGVNVSGAETKQAYIVENTGTGVAVFDFDNDGLLDIFFVNGDRFDRREGETITHFLYRNKGGLRFEDVTAASGITHDGWGQGVCAGDIDNDGYVDLYVGYWGQNVLYRNQGDGTFRNETAERGLGTPGRRWGTGCAFFDYDRDGWLDLFVAHYLEFDPAKVPAAGTEGGCRWKGFPVVCGPIGLPPETMSLYHNEGNGRFRDVTVEAGVSTAKAAGLTVLTADFDNDGWVDVYVTGDSTPSLLFRNLGDGKFEEMGEFLGVAYNEDGHEQSGMGAWAADYDHDGWLDIVKTNFTDDIPNLYRNFGDGSFVEVTAAAGLAIHTQFVGWGVAFLDFDHDGWKDIFIANGHVYPDIDTRNVGQTFRQPRLLYWNRRDGEYYDMSRQAGPGIAARHSSRGIALGDLDNDGDQEIVVVNMHEPPSLLKNFGPKANSVLVQALTRDGRDAIGARVTLRTDDGTQIDEVRSGGFYESQGDFRVHFGVGNAKQAKLSIRWPDGKEQSWEKLPVNHWIVVRQGKGIIEKRPLAKP